MNIQPMKSNTGRAIIYPLLFTTLLWTIHLISYLLNIESYRYGVYPRTLEGLKGILTAPLIHGSWNHLFSNTLPLLVLGFVIFSTYPQISKRAIPWIYFLTGFWVWAAARPVYHIGASGIVYGLASFLFFIGVFRWDKKSIAVALFVAFLYGGLIWGIFPLWPGISWESHLFGGVAGFVTAFGFYTVNRPHVAVSADEPDDPDMPYWEYEVEGERKKRTHLPHVIIRYLYKPNRNDDQHEG